METDRQEDALQATKAEVTATLSYLNVLGDRVGKQEVELAGRRAVDTRLSVCLKILILTVVVMWKTLLTVSRNNVRRPWQDGRKQKVNEMLS